MCHVDHTNYNEVHVYICLLLASFHGFPQDDGPSIFRRNMLRSLLEGMIRVKRTVTRKGTNDKQVFFAPRTQSSTPCPVSNLAPVVTVRKRGYIRAKTKRRPPGRSQPTKETKRKTQRTMRSADLKLQTSSQRWQSPVVPDTRGIPFSIPRSTREIQQHRICLQRHIHEHPVAESIDRLKAYPRGTTNFNRPVSIQLRTKYPSSSSMLTPP